MTPRSEPAGPNEPAEPTYSYRPSLVGAPWTYRLTDNALVWEAGSKSGRVLYRDVRCVRLSYKPVSMQTHRFVTEIWADGSPRLKLVSSSWKSMVEQERLDAAYTAFLRALHRRLRDAGARVDYRQGGNPFVYWPGVVMFVVVALALAGVMVRALQVHALGGVVIVFAFLALFLWQSGNFFRRNRPGRYAPEALPSELLPKG